MLDKLNLKLLKKQNYYLIGVSKTKETSIVSCAIISLDNDNLKIDNLLEFETFDLCLKNLKKEYPVILYFEGDAVLNKISDRKSNYKKDLIFNANLDNFYFYEFFQDEKIYSSIIRKKTLNEYINKLAANNLFLLEIGFGPFVMAHLFSYITQYEKLRSNIYTLKFKNDKIVSFEKEKNDMSFNYEINQDNISVKEIPLLALFLGFINKNNQIESTVPDLLKNRIEYKYKKKFKLFVFTSIITLIVLLLVSHNLQNFYHKKIIEKNIKKYN